MRCFGKGKCAGDVRPEGTAADQTVESSDDFRIWIRKVTLDADTGSRLGLGLDTAGVG
jgi:hypothetical protein